MLYRPAISNAAVLAEQLLCHEQVATFYAHPWGAHLLWDQQTLLLARAGVPTPRTFHRVPRDRDQLRHIVAALGGFPVILKALGGSLGVGVMRLDSFPALFSVVDYALSRGSSLNLMACVEPATHWRVVVVGDSIAAAYRNQPDDDDFRTHVEDRPEDFLGEAPPEVLETAIRATQLLGLEFGGVDLLEHDSGRVYLLEVNFPCYFGHPKEIAGVDVAGVMLDHLRAKARALRAP
jgi:glutathione synthase/RimK-type ligase-like ATP-grasp enzyme